MKRFCALTLATALVLPVGCRPPPAKPGGPVLRSNNRSMTGRVETGPNQPTPGQDLCVIVLAPHRGDAKLDQQIRKIQSEIPASIQPELQVERLGWCYVAKARASCDAGFYKLAELCALCLEARAPGSPESLLLRGHALQNLHRFREAEPIARQLVEGRGLPFDHGLLGDVLMEQGKLTEAILEYQTMVDGKPDSHAYARIAHVRWLKGDLRGAIGAMGLAAGATGPQAAEPAAWIQTRLGLYLLQAGFAEAAREAAEVALALQNDYPPALLLLGRIGMADERPAAALDPLKRACERNPLPEYQWAWSEALNAAGQTNEAGGVETQLLKTGAVNDPRTFALFLATKKLQPARAVALAERELEQRADVHSHDALAWAMAAADRWTEARRHSQQALAESTADPRLHLHAGLIALHLGLDQEAQLRLADASRYGRLLLPSERAALAVGWQALGLDVGAAPAAAPAPRLLPAASKGSEPAPLASQP